MLSATSLSGRHNWSFLAPTTQTFPLCVTSMSQTLGLCAILAVRSAPKRPRWLDAESRPIWAVSKLPGPRKVWAEPGPRMVTTSPPWSLIFAVADRVLPGGYAFADGPNDLTTTTLASAAVEPTAIAIAAPQSSGFTLMISAPSLRVGNVIFDRFGLAQAPAGRRAVLAVRDGFLLVHDFGEQLSRHPHADQKVIVLARQQCRILFHVADQTDRVIRSFRKLRANGLPVGNVREHVHHEQSARIDEADDAAHED